MKTIKFVGICLFLCFCAANTVFAQSYNFYNSYSNYDPYSSFSFNEQGIRIGDAEFNDIVSKQYGPISIKTKLASEMDYDSNIFWTPNNKKADTINITSPGILVDMPLGLEERHLLQFMYDADIGTFAKYSSQNYVNQYAALNGDFKLPFGYLDIQDHFDHTSDRADTEFTGEVVRTDNDASAALGVELNKLSLETGYVDSFHFYDDTPLYGIYDYTEDMVSETAYYEISPKTKTLLEYDHGWLTYDRDTARSGGYDQVRVGVKGDIAPKTQAIIKVGYQNRTYDNSVNWAGFVAEAGVTTQFTERTKLSLTYDQGAQESVYLNNNYYDLHYFYATLDEKLMSHLNLELNSGINRNIYPAIDPVLFQKRMDSIIVEGIAFKYSIREWASAKLGYTFREDMSTIRSQSYNDHLWSLGFQIQF